MKSYVINYHASDDADGLVKGQKFSANALDVNELINMLNLIRDYGYIFDGIEIEGEN